MKTWQKIKNQPELPEKYLVREKVIDTIRDFFKSRKFREVQTPILVSIPSCEPNLEPFKTELVTAGGERRDGYLIMSPEYQIKKLLAAGMGNCFEIARCFRNGEEVSDWHNFEFTMLEWYRVGADYTEIMTDFEELFLEIINKTLRFRSGQANRTYIKHQGQEYDISLPWLRISVAEAFEKMAGVDVLKVADEDFYKIFFNEIEPKLRESRRPVFIYDYPVSQASLARKKADDLRFAERFEVFLAGVELGNCFSELTDPEEQRKRFEKEISLRQALGKSVYEMDNELLEALKTMPETAGIAVGVDRLIMLAADVPSIADTLFFPGKKLFKLGTRD